MTLTAPTGTLREAPAQGRGCVARAAGEAQVAKHLAAQLGKTHHILMENAHMGRTEQFTEVAFGDNQEIGAIVEATITGQDGPKLHVT